MAEKYDVVVIGAGPGGYVAAIRAAELGFKTACIDSRKEPGGTCLNVGCIPSKALLYTTEYYQKIKTEAGELGISASNVEINFKQMMDRKQKVVNGLNEGVLSLFKADKVDFINGHAKFINSTLCSVESKEGTKEIEASYYILATGSEPIALPNVSFDEKQVISSTGALSLNKIPQRMAVIGGGAIGVELASVYSRLGTKITVIEMLDKICPLLDSSLSKGLHDSLKKQGIEFLLSSQMSTCVVQPNEVILTILQENRLDNLSVDVVLIAVGRRPFTKNLNLDKAGVETDKRGFVKIDSHFKTSQNNIYAIGDVIEGPMLAHKASQEGIVVVERLAGLKSSINYMAIPNVVYTSPEAASVGLTEEEAKASNLEILVGKSFFKANARARCTNETAGFVKIIGEKHSERLIGLHILGEHASELIAEGMIAIEKRATLKDIADVPHAHPTLSETIKEAALAARATKNPS